MKRTRNAVGSWTRRDLLKFAASVPWALAAFAQARGGRKRADCSTDRDGVGFAGYAGRPGRHSEPDPGVKCSDNRWSALSCRLRVRCAQSLCSGWNFSGQHFQRLHHSPS